MTFSSKLARELSKRVVQCTAADRLPMKHSAALTEDPSQSSMEVVETIESVYSPFSEGIATNLQN